MKQTETKAEQYIMECVKDYKREDIIAHAWLYRLLCVLESQYKDKQ